MFRRRIDKNEGRRKHESGGSLCLEQKWVSPLCFPSPLCFLCVQPGHNLSVWAEPLLHRRPRQRCHGDSIVELLMQRLEAPATKRLKS